MWHKLPVKDRMDLMRSYRKGGYHYRDAVKDYNDSYQKFPGGGKFTSGAGPVNTESITNVSQPMIAPNYNYNNNYNAYISPDIGGIMFGANARFGNVNVGADVFRTKGFTDDYSGETYKPQYFPQVNVGYVKKFPDGGTVGDSTAVKPQVPVSTKTDYYTSNLNDYNKRKQMYADSSIIAKYSAKNIAMVKPLVRNGNILDTDYTNIVNTDKGRNEAIQAFNRLTAANRQYPKGKDYSFNSVNSSGVNMGPYTIEQWELPTQKVHYIDPKLNQPKQKAEPQPYNKIYTDEVKFNKANQNYKDSTMIYNLGKTNDKGTLRKPTQEEINYANLRNRKYIGIEDQPISVKETPTGAVFQYKKPVERPVLQKPIIPKPPTTKPAELDTSNWEQSSLDSLSAYNYKKIQYNKAVQMYKDSIDIYDAQERYKKEAEYIKNTSKTDVEYATRMGYTAGVGQSKKEGVLEDATSVINSTLQKHPDWRPISNIDPGIWVTPDGHKRRMENIMTFQKPITPKVISNKKPVGVQKKPVTDTTTVTKSVVKPIIAPVIKPASIYRITTNPKSKTGAKYYWKGNTQITEEEYNRNNK